MTCWIVGFALLGVIHALEEVAIWKSESSCKIGYSFVRFGFAQSTIYVSPERCLAQPTWPCPPERRWIVFGRTAWTTRPQRHGFPHWSRGGSSSWSPCARFSGAHLQFEGEWEQTTNKQPESFFEFKTWWFLEFRTAGDGLPSQGDGTTRAKVKYRTWNRTSMKATALQITRSWGRSLLCWQRYIKNYSDNMDDQLN